MNDKINCSACQCLKPANMFIGKQGQPTKTCSRCRDVKKKVWTYRDDKDKCPRCRCWRSPEIFFKNGIKLKSCSLCRDRSNEMMKKKRSKSQNQQLTSDIETAV